MLAFVCLTAPDVRAQGGDRDGDGFADSQDSCPHFADANQTDTDSDGRGDACECTDQTGDGRNSVGDIVAINLAIFTPALATPLCDGNNDGLCNVADIIAANIEIFSPASTSTCARQPVPERPATDRGALLLNEVRFAPPATDPPFIELGSVGATGAALETFTITNERGEQLRSPGEVTVPSGGLALIVFDGDERIEGATIHVNRPGFLSSVSGELELRDAGGVVIDRVRWGAGPGSASRGRGGFASGFPEGGSIGRFPSSIAIDPAGWEVFESGEVTPGGVNPSPRVRVLLPFSGALFEPGSVDLAWYPPPGSTQYRVQLASDASFASPILDVMVDVPEFSTSALVSGTYHWRVRSISESGLPAEFSETSLLTIQSAPGAAVSSALPGPRLLGATALIQNALAVPLKAQRKDTAMLLLETPRETGAHAWNAAHAQGSMADAADWTCAAASVSMINAFFGGSLSQDRINFEVLRDDLDGPEGDLIFGQGLDAGQITRAVTFALGAAPAGFVDASTADLEGLWSVVKGEIDAGRPLLMAKTGPAQGHVGVIRGYLEDGNGRRIVINDPSRGRSYQMLLSALPRALVWLIPTSVSARSDEPELSMDLDGDGLRDFDELSRFHTDPDERDTDDDAVSDYLDVRASVHDPNRGYANGFRASDRRRIDTDQDARPMELDQDSDADGCTDGFEDSNQNGRFEPQANETWNFDGQDLGCRFVGSVSATREMRIEIGGYTHTTSESSSATNLVWELDPLFGDGAGGQRRFRLVSGAVTWSHQGVVDIEPREPDSSYPCSGSASGNDAVGGSDLEAEIIIDDTTTPATITAQAGVLTGHFATYTCADGIRVDQPVALPAVYFSTDGPKDLPAGDPGPVPTTLTESATLAEHQPGTSVDVSWHWNFVGVPD